ncbi:type II 3-dehydroquinate dehydratase [Planobacterium oryzisoli]|uniref:3-dehydroquinate dehydratase n=1 Tax=Planobacterium oryzisoli TaxID=2771435 RepID=A0A930YUY5_9FLAO|nr:type II 3-dehydroquinate dehydratase [Planobacterium oryzisoli]MBF5026820.1 type II 3-dehydroquinate dehydratase [Planobacterium oryzisoli]
MRILILNGPNLNLLGSREPEIYGELSMEQYLENLRPLFDGTLLEYYQSNHEGVIIDRLQEGDFDALVINPGAYTHYSYAIADALRTIAVPKVEVHISNIYKREEFRRKSVTAPAMDGLISGFGLEGYRMAVQFLTQNKKAE